MKKFKLKNERSKSRFTNRLSLVREASPSHLRSGSYDTKVLKSILLDLSKFEEGKKRKPRQYCQLERLKKETVDHQVKLRCRQLPSVVQHLRKAIMRQNWDEVTTLLIILCHPGLKHYKVIIIKVCFILLFGHSNSDFVILQDFIRSTTEYILDEDVNKFVRILLALRKSALIPLRCGQYIRKTGDYKVTRDPEFEKL